MFFYFVFNEVFVYLNIFVTEYDEDWEKGKPFRLKNRNRIIKKTKQKNSMKMKMKVIKTPQKTIR